MIGGDGNWLFRCQQRRMAWRAHKTQWQFKNEYSFLFCHSNGFAQVPLTMAPQPRPHNPMDLTPANFCTNEVHIKMACLLARVRYSHSCNDDVFSAATERIYHVIVMSRWVTLNWCVRACTSCSRVDKNSRDHFAHYPHNTQTHTHTPRVSYA